MMYRCNNIISIIIILLTSFVLSVVVIAIDRSDGERRNTTTSTHTPDVALSSSLERNAQQRRHEGIVKLQEEKEIVLKHSNNNSNNSTMMMNMMLNMTLCSDKCENYESCKSYITPINVCYSSSILFPNDISWSGKDIHDTIICQTLIRNIYDTDNGTCRRQDDNNDNKFLIPLNECVGPFGVPRPWGTFRLAIRNHDEDKDGDYHSNAGLLTTKLLCDDGDTRGDEMII